MLPNDMDNTYYHSQVSSTNNNDTPVWFTVSVRLFGFVVLASLAFIFLYSSFAMARAFLGE